MHASPPAEGFAWAWLGGLRAPSCSLAEDVTQQPTEEAEEQDGEEEGLPERRDLLHDQAKTAPKPLGHQLQRLDHDAARC